MATTIHIVQRMAPGGIESIVLDLARLDPETRVISLEGSRQALVEAWPGLSALGDRLEALAKGEGWQPRLWLALGRLFRRHRPRAIITHHIGPLVYAGLAALVAGIGRRIHVEHDGWHYAAPRRRLLARMVDRLVAPRRVAVSHVTATQVAGALGSIGQTIIPNGVDLDRFHARDALAARVEFGLPREAFLIGCIGRLERVKGQDVLIRTLARLDTRCHLVLAGDGRARADLEALVRLWGMTDRVTFLGQVNQPERLYPAFDVFCLPSRAEGFPRSLIEAQACGIPVVATDVGGSREAVCPQTGRLVPAENEDELALAITETLAFGPPAPSPRAFVDPAFSNALMLDRYRALTAA
jgi:glycosyltransferase involved in cell wall biosynthesis